ncbi:MAG: hypothetical protein ACXACU_16665 [Candidatus Hodarchaeales archaeon]|jgi:hypothetical protein
MRNYLRILVIGILFFITALTLLMTLILGSSEPGTRTGSDSSPMFLMILIAGLVFVVVPGIFVVARFVRR